MTCRSALQRILWVSVALVSGAGLAVELLRPLCHLSGQRGLVPLLSLSYEGNLPTWFSSALLLCAAALLGLIAADVRQRGERFLPHWIALALGFAYISLDEVVSIHESAGALVRGSGWLYFSWVIPAAGLLLLLSLAYARFLLHLPSPIRARFALAGALYVAGAVGMELPLGRWTERHGQDNLGYGLLDWVEETLEMSGVALFILALHDLLALRGVVLRFGPRRAEQDRPVGQ
jgi:hypothetical protein